MQPMISPPTGVCCSVTRAHTISRQSSTRGNRRVKLSKRTEYGLRAVVQLARLGPRSYVQSKDLAQQEGLPNKFLEADPARPAARGFPREQGRQRRRVSAVAAAARDPRRRLIRRLEGRLTVKEPVPDRASCPPARSPST